MRHEALWVAWAAVALTAFALLANTFRHDAWWREPGLVASFGSWVPALALAWLLGPSLSRWTGTGSWVQRLCMVYAVAGLALSSLISLFAKEAPLFYLAGFAALGAMAWTYSRRRLFDIFVLSAVGLACNLLVASALVRLMLLGPQDSVLALLAIALVSTGMLTWTVKTIMRLSQDYREGEHA
jgi:hypothetical protein